MKTKHISKKAIEHLIDDLGYKSDSAIEVLADAPFLLINDNTVKAIYSVGEYNRCPLKEVSEHKILSIHASIEVKKLSRVEQLIIKLVNKLNMNKYKDISGYEVAFNYNFDVKGYPDRPRIYPVTNCACGGISSETMQLIIDFSKENGISPYFTYCSVKGQTEKYGTYSPCVTFY